MINNEKDYLQGIRDCRQGRVPPADATEDYLKGYAREIDYAHARAAEHAQIRFPREVCRNA